MAAGEKAYRVYIIANPCGRAYIGISADVAIRVSQHNSGSSKWTAKYRPWQLIRTSHALSLTDARKLENLLKRQKGGLGLKPLLAKHGLFTGS